MRHIRILALAASGLCALGTASTASAGGCGYGVPAQACAPSVVVNQGAGPAFGPMSVNINQPMGHLRSVNYTRSPNVSITRVHGMAPMADVTDFPSGFTKGCHPTSTTYCRQDMGTPVNVSMGAPVMPAPVMPAPVISAPRTVAVGGGYDPSKFIPRQYGENVLTPGIVHAPTSFIDRSPVRAQNALMAAGGGSTGYIGTTAFAGAPGPRVMPLNTAYGYAGGMVTSPYTGGTVSLAPSVGPSMTATTLPSPAIAGSSSGTQVSPVAPDGSYWEQVSGVTKFGDTIATKVVCKRQLPRRTVRPVIGVPVPVPTPMPVGCAPVRGMPVMAGAPVARPVPVMPHAPMGVAQAPIQGRWTY